MRNHIERICRMIFEGQQIKRSCPKLSFCFFWPIFQNCHFLFLPTFLLFFFFFNFFKTATFCFANFSGQKTLCTLFCKSKEFAQNFHSVFFLQFFQNCHFYFCQFCFFCHFSELQLFVFAIF